MRGSFSVVALLAVTVAGCDQFVCSQQRIKAMELSNRGTQAFNNNLYDSAEREFKQAIQTDPSYEIAYYNLGKVFQKQRKWDKAIEYFEAAVQRAPTNGNYHYDLGEAYLEAKRIEDAEKALKGAIAADPNLPKAHWRLGLVYKNLDQPTEADRALRAAIVGNPRLDKPFVALGYLYLDYDFNQEAAQVFSECTRVNKDSPECYNGHGMALKELKKYEEGTRSLKAALELDGTMTDALYNLGMTYAEWFDQTHANEQKDKAREYLQKFVATGGGKDGGMGYVRAANDKLYALSGP